MIRILGLLNVVAWSGFWAFGYLALSSEGYSERELSIAVALGALGLLGGMVGYLKLMRIAEHTGLAAASNRSTREERDRAQAKWGETHSGKEEQRHEKA
ncbi:hypothetical protein GG681_03645 [Epibacterium sp. SM1969]|uniref:Uncharacterized protein n=1 Tax=Tritonibacter aquimaris TaxID=2663379 RepID=A0A844AKK8_9RHOB|nr:hypothetical protein [Tritonibacter aquimaris]MQY41719.1 hypothetical protein [Tritonibacter aquimaris]